MTTVFPLAGIVVCALTLWAAAEDLLWRKIRNRLVLTIFAVTAVAALGLHARGVTAAELGLAAGGLFALCVLVTGFVLSVNSLLMYPVKRIEPCQERATKV